MKACDGASIAAAAASVVAISRILLFDRRVEIRRMAPIIQTVSMFAIGMQIHSLGFDQVWPIMSVVCNAPILCLLGYTNYISVVNITALILLDIVHLLLIGITVASHHINQKWIMWSMSTLFYIPIIFFIFGDVELEVFMAHYSSIRRANRIESIGNYLLLSWLAYPIIGSVDLTMTGDLNYDHFMINDIINKVFFPLWLLWVA